MPHALPLATPRGQPRGQCLLSDRRGVSAVEFAMLLPLLITLLLGAFDIGNAFQQAIRLEAAARAGAQAAFSNPTPENMANIVALVKSNLPSSLSNGATVTAQNTSCRCDSGLDGTCDFNGACAIPKIVSITVTRPFTYIGPFTQFLLPNLSPVTGNAEVRLF